MKATTLLVPATLGLLAVLSGCGVAARSPEMYRDDTKVVLEKKNDEIRGCYDGVLKGSPGVGGKLTVKFDVLTDSGKITNVSVDKANTTVSEAVAACVTKAIDGLTLNPADVRLGQGTWVYEFTAPAGPVAPGKS